MLAYAITYRICLGLQRSDAALVGHGVETGVIKRLPDGRFVEVHAPLPEDAAAHIGAKEPVPELAVADNREGVPPTAVRGVLGRLRGRMSRAYGGEKVPLVNGHGEEERAAVAAGDRPLTH
ncbi:hypothetical protein HNP84_002140 [Thermocatellispora tengchongensis]|uniref:Uncharacterized protein n=1 Tax=Thermocatellispora tengchongensis TaxID=1073253 RepID=A0A840NUK3_9ACTN|nr:hypothetical protein [Thermocatellispora tengchongensis]MBB5132424.1 hypothetical protein [Thermocatellispora tengchongensis]